MPLVNINRFFAGNATDITVRDVCSGDYLYAVGTDFLLGPGAAVWKSENGITWDRIPEPPTTGLIGCAAIGENVDRGRLVVVSFTKVYEKDVAGVWTDVTPAGFNGALFKSIKYLPGTGFCLMMSDAGGTYFRMSTDGVIWVNSISARPNMEALVAGTPGFLASKILVPRDSIFSPDGGGTWVQYVENINLYSAVWNGGLTNWFTNGGVIAGEFKIYKADFAPAIWTLILDAPGFVTDSAAFVFFNAKLFMINANDTEHGSLGNFIILQSVDGITWESAGSYTQPHSLGSVLQTGYVNKLVLRGVYFAPGTFNAGRYYLYTFIDTDSDYGPDDFSNSFSNENTTPPENPEPAVDGTGNVTITFEMNQNPVEEVTGALIAKSLSDGTSAQIAGQVDFEAGTTEYTFTDPTPIGVGEIWIYWILAFSNTLDSISEPLVLEEIVVPDIVHQGNIILDIALAAILVYSVNPSGIYTLVKNKRHDTLYERLGAITTVEAAIPDPFFKTGFIGDQPSGEY